MGMEVREGFRMGNTCTPMADSCQYMAKPLQYCKVISLQLKKKKIQNHGDVDLKGTCTRPVLGFTHGKLLKPQKGVTCVLFVHLMLFPLELT